MLDLGSDSCEFPVTFNTIKTLLKGNWRSIDKLCLHRYLLSILI